MNGPPNSHYDPNREEERQMDSAKWIGMDFHKETVSITVRNQTGKIVIETVIATTAWQGHG